MGASNVAKVFTWWTHLSDRDIRALAFMANVAKDGGEPPVYFGGWEAIAEAMQGNASKRTVMRILSSLSDAGAVVSSRQARNGTRAEYALCLDPQSAFEPCGKGRDVLWIKLWRTDPRVSATDTHRVSVGDTHRVSATGIARVSATGTPRVSATDTPRINKRINKGIQEELPDSQRKVTSGDASEPAAKFPLTESKERERQLAALRSRYGDAIKGGTQ